jgi:hypothetical protein
MRLSERKHLFDKARFATAESAANLRMAKIYSARFASLVPNPAVEGERLRAAGAVPADDPKLAAACGGR